MNKTERILIAAFTHAISLMLCRQQVIYNKDTLEDIICHRNEFINQMQPMKRRKEHMIHANQQKAAAEMIAHFKDPRVLNVMCVAPMQSGKTGIMISFIDMYMQQNYIPKTNIFIITNTASTDWKKQTESRVPQCLHANIYHHGELSKFSTKLKSMKESGTLENILICIDEPQVASKIDQSLAKLMRECGVFGKKERLKRDIKMVQVSATPNATLKSLENWGDDYSKVVHATPGEEYTGYEKLLNNNQISQCKELVGTDNIDNIREIKNVILNYKTPRYHIIRMKTGKNFYKETRLTFQSIFEDSVKFEEYNMKTETDDINKFLDHEPKIHTIIFIIDANFNLSK